MAEIILVAAASGLAVLSIILSLFCIGYVVSAQEQYKAYNATREAQFAKLVSSVNVALAICRQANLENEADNKANQIALGRVSAGRLPNV